MFAILLAGLIACASAAPQWHRHHHAHAPSPFDGSLERYLNEQIFDTNRFWDELSRDLNREMQQLETMLSDFSKHFPNLRSSEGIEGNEYKITIPLSGFDEKDIVVKARKGLLMIQAVHNGQNSNNYLDVRTLPACVGERGSWSYKDDILTVILPVEQSGDSGTKELTPETVTPVPDRSREETESPVLDNEQVGDIDGIARGDLAKENDIKTNEIPDVEATTYAVDFNNEVEFVPAKY